MSTTSHSSHHRLLAVIAPGDGPHLLAPTVAGFRSHRATPKVSIADELAACLATLGVDSEHYRRAAASWHARWCLELTTFTVAERHTTRTLLHAIAGARGADAARTLGFLCRLHDEREVAAVLERWIEDREHPHGEL
jgi:hypothetical protein